MQIQFYQTSWQAWEAELEEIAKAKKTIDLESFIFLGDKIGMEFLEALATKVKEGVRVRCVFDAMGSMWLSKKTIAWCKEHGIELNLFHRILHSKVRVPFWKRMLERTHRKALIIDNATAFVGGVNIEEAHREWRDIQIKIQSHEVAAIQETFNQTWKYLQGGYLKRIRVRVGERLEHVGKHLKNQVFFHNPDQKSQSFRKLFKYLIHNAKKDVLLITPYFFPSAPLLKYMGRAVKRGVTVRLLAPWSTEIKWTIPLMREYVRAAKISGVEVRQAGLPWLHAKAFLIDGHWGVVGSANINQRSLLFDRELSVIIGDAETSKKLKEIMEGWWEQGTPITVAQMIRPWKEWVLGLPARVLRRFI